jgi:transcriptional regulator with XRE-family HTH domain
MLSIMPAHSALESPFERQLLVQLGERLRRARIARDVTAVELAERLGISRTTLRAVESGDPSPTIGTYLRVLRTCSTTPQTAAQCVRPARCQISCRSPSEAMP